ncbi:MAG: hypothetical protein NC041_03175 [Bacteroides sp.]|nr:hypothetical protein [Prevotella sp.]MCM1408126.1 hypothetical protein [Treponema brennaborense]MCM1469450.1 hypothetical protein [Bacteroides sp.]
MIEVKSKEEFKELANSLSYRYAKTYTNFAPHEYAMAEDGTKELEIIRALNKYIQENGEEEKFYNKTFQVLFIDTNKYWSVDEWQKTRFLNRNWDFKEENGTINRTKTESRKGSLGCVLLIFYS